VSITVRKDNADNSTKKAGIKLEQDSNGQVTVKNIATNGLFGDTELEIGDTILSVNRRRLNTSEGEGPDLIMKWVHKYNTITISVRKKPVSLVSSSSDESTNSSNKKDKKSSTKKKKKKNKNKTTTKSSKEDVTNNNNKIVTITAEVNTTTPTGYSLTNSNTKNKRKSNKSTTTTTPPTTTIGLVLEIRQDDQLFVKEIQHDSLFFVSSSSTPGSDTGTDMLEVGDRILCINDMSFRQYADLDYAYQVMNKAKICITLHVEKQAKKKKTTTKKGTSNKIPKSSMSSLTSSLASSSCNDNGDDDVDDDTSIKSFTDDDSDEELDSSKKSTHSKKKKKKATSASSTTTSSTTTNSSKYKFDVQKSEFKIEKYCPVTITVPTAQTGYTKSSDSIGLEFRLVETNKGDALNTIVEDQKNNRNKHDRTKWVYVHKIEEDSIFQNTALKEGDKVISINDTDLRCSGAPTSKTTKRSGSRSASSSSSEDGGEGTTNIDTRKAYKACLQAKEFITLIVVKDDDSIFLEKSFCFDASSTDLDWKI